MKDISTSCTSIIQCEWWTFSFYSDWWQLSFLWIRLSNISILSSQATCAQCLEVKEDQFSFFFPPQNSELGYYWGRIFEMKQLSLKKNLLMRLLQLMIYWIMNWCEKYFFFNNQRSSLQVRLIHPLIDSAKSYTPMNIWKYF